MKVTGEQSGGSLATRAGSYPMFRTQSDKENCDLPRAAANPHWLCQARQMFDPQSEAYCSVIVLVGYSCI